MAPYLFECSIDGCDFETEGEAEESVAEDAHRHATEKHEDEMEESDVGNAIVQTT